MLNKILSESPKILISILINFTLNDKCYRTWVIVKIVQKFQPPRGRRLAMAKGPSFRTTKNAHLRDPCLQLFSNLIRIFQNIQKKSVNVETAPQNFKKVPEIYFPKISKSYFKKREF